MIYVKLAAKTIETERRLNFMPRILMIMPPERFRDEKLEEISLK